MHGRIESGQFVTLSPVDPAQVRVDDDVLVQWKGNYLLHLVKGINADQLLIGNNLGKINGWVSAQAVRGVVVAVIGDPAEPDTAADDGGVRESQRRAARRCRVRSFAASAVIVDVTMPTSCRITAADGIDASKLGRPRWK
jgi:hypothetical protein